MSVVFQVHILTDFFFLHVDQSQNHGFVTLACFSIPMVAVQTPIWISQRLGFSARPS